MGEARVDGHGDKSAAAPVKDPFATFLHPLSLSHVTTLRATAGSHTREGILHGKISCVRRF
jgi:hypothetical protein